jgi:hypothetical protein
LNSSGSRRFSLLYHSNSMSMVTDELDETALEPETSVDELDETVTDELDETALEPETSVDELDETEGSFAHG